MTQMTQTKNICPWAISAPDYLVYHNDEWGHPEANDIKLFEKICLEGFQSGLSWITILRKRENFRTAFASFDFHKVAEFTEHDVQRLLNDEGIVRHQGKIRATINNAQRVLEILKEFNSFAAYMWQFEPKPSERPSDLSWDNLKTITTCDSAVRLSKDLKKRGFKFVGPTTCYALMQAMGMVNDHAIDCPSRAVIEKKRAEFARPE